MPSFPARDVATALTNKGFERRETHHTYFHFRHQGKDVGITTKISQGEREIGIGLAKRMRTQMKLQSNAEFGEFVECSLTREQYVLILKKQGIIPPDPA